MNLEHNQYKEAFSDIGISEERGMEILTCAMRKSERRRRKWSVQVAVAACVLLTATAGNGICYAKTGQNVWELFQSTMYQDSRSGEVTAIAENSKISGETIKDGNRQYTLEYYWYDAENGNAYFAIRTDSLDQTPLREDAKEYMLEPLSYGNYGGIQIHESKPVFSEDKLSVRRYFYLMFSYSHEGKNTDKLGIELNVEDGGVNENGCPTYRQPGHFDLEPTGEMKSCYADGGNVLDGCREIRITGAGMQMSLDRNLKLESEMEGRDSEETDLTPFSFIDIRMKDGSVYHILGKLPEGDEMIWDKVTGECAGYIHRGETVTGDSYLGAVVQGGGFDPYGTSAWEEMFTVVFERFIDVEEIAGVYLDGTELPLK